MSVNGAVTMADHNRDAEHSEQEDFEDAHDDSQTPTGATDPNGRPNSLVSNVTSNSNRPLSGVSVVSAIGKEDDNTHSTQSARARAQSHAAPPVPPRKMSNAGGGSSAAETLLAKTRTASFGNSHATTPVSPVKPTVKPSRFPNFSASLPSVPWGGNSKPAQVRSPSPQPPSKDGSLPTKRTTPFGWLTRATSGKDPKSPPLPPKSTIDSRRGTAASISTLGSNQDLMLRAIEEAADGQNNARGPARNSLKERFKLLRLREEIGVSALEGENTADFDPVTGAAIASPYTIDDREPPLRSPSIHIPPSPAATINQNLAPGTVSGFSVAAVDSAIPIDWDFWQTVVNEGPQAVARTSPEELTTAISGGIPSTIRGVIWQVLASSKNEDLEVVYHELKLRGTKDELALSTIPPPGQPDAKEKGSTISSRSSIRSERSTPGTSTNAAANTPSPSQERGDPIQDAKAQAQEAADRAKRAKEDASALTKLERMIRRDMGSRTSYSKYAAAAGYQDGLFNVCKAYALFDEGVGYPQGMNFIIMPMLFNMPEEEAFCLLVRLMNKYQLRELFIQDMPGLHLHLYQFERLLEDLEPALYCHLNRRSVTPRLYATQWFLTLFAYRLPLQLVTRVFDLILCEGLEGAILKFGMGLMQKNVDTLLGMNDMQALTNYLKEKLFDAYIDASPNSKSILESGFFGSSGGTENDVYRADLLVQDACAVKLTPEMLTRYTAEYEEKTRTERERETELENLRTDTATKASQIRSLEQRAETSDAEHIEIANELVKHKVENQDLMDENETLQGQVEELRKVAASEASTVEARMREGTEKVMQRNIEVQNENRHMEEQMAEMERELVAMKMKYAELNGEHDTLKQRWLDLRKAIE